MRYKKEFKIKGRIVKKDDLISLVESIISQYKSKNELSTTIEAKFDDGTTISDSKVTIFEDKYFDKLLLKRIDIHIIYNYANHVDIYIYSDSEYSSATIESDDESIYNSICNCINENIKLMNKQNKLYLISNNYWLTIGLYIVIVSIQLFSLFLIQYLFNINIPTMFIYIVFWLSAPIYFYLLKYIEKQFPINQFDFGDNSINRYNRKINIVWKIIIYIALNIVVPFIINYLSR